MLPGGSFCFGVVGAIILLVGLGFFWNVVMDWRKYRESDNWIPVTGLVIASEVTEQYSDDGDGITYSPGIIYTYLVMGKNYQSREISFGSKGVTYNFRKKAERVVARHPAGSQPIIHYDPDDPSQAVLERKYDPYKAILGLTFGLFGAWMLYLVYIQ